MSPPGVTLLRASWAGTVLFVIVSLTAVFVEPARAVAVAVSLGLFLAGVGSFFWAYAVAIGRSRAVAIGIGGLYFLAGATAPASVRRWFMASLFVEVVIALATASARPFTSLAFGILVPMYGIGVAGVWGARHGSFPPRVGATAER